MVGSELNVVGLLMELLYEIFRDLVLDYLLDWFEIGGDVVN